MAGVAAGCLQFAKLEIPKYDYNVCKGAVPPKVLNAKF
jgi:hypothetical protein